MIEPAHLPDSPRIILVTRLDGLGDLVLGTQLLWGLHAKWPDAKVLLVVRPQMSGVGAILPEWVEVRAMPFDPREPVCEQETRIIEQLRELAASMPADLAIVAEYNRTWAGEILADTCGAPTVLAFDGPTGLNFRHASICAALNVGSLDRWRTVHTDADTREPLKYIAFLDALGLDGKSFQPNLVLQDEDREAAKELWSTTGAEARQAVVCFPGSGDLTRSLDPGVWNRWINHLALTRPVIVFGSHSDEPVLTAICGDGIAPGARRLLVPNDKIGTTAAFLEKAHAYLGADTGPMHIAAAVGTPTLGVFGGGYRAERFLPVGRKTAAIRMPLGCYGCDWLCPFDRRHCIKDIPEAAIYEAADRFLETDRDNPSPLEPYIFDFRPPAELPAVTLGATMRQHRQFLNLNHEVTEHHAYLAGIRAQQQAKFDELSTTLHTLSNNHGETLNHLAASLAEMTLRNSDRDQAISTLMSALTAMTQHNVSRDEAIAKINAVLTEMSRINEVRDRAIATLQQRVWFIPKTRK